MLLGKQIEVQGRDLLHKRINKVLHVLSINGLNILPALITQIHPIADFLFAEKIVQRFVTLIIAKRAVYSPCPPLMSAKAAKEGSFPFIPED